MCMSLHNDSKTNIICVFSLVNKFTCVCDNTSLCYRGHLAFTSAAKPVAIIDNLLVNFKLSLADVGWTLLVLAVTNEHLLAVKY